MIKFVNFQRELASTVDDDIGNVDGLILRVGGSSDVGKLKEFFDDRKYGC